MLTGNSPCAMLRAKISAVNSRPPPTKLEKTICRKRLVFNNNPAIWGASKPINEINPTILTTAPVSKVAKNSTPHRRTDTGTPSIWASSWCRCNMRMGRCSKQMITRAITTKGTEAANLSAVTSAKLPIVQNSMAANCFSGSAVSFKNISRACVKAFTAIPDNTTLERLLFPEIDANTKQQTTANNPPTKEQATTVMPAPPKNKIATAAPTEEPEATPIISGDAKGFWNTR